jgi:predicted glycogen debranching enzyme
MHEDCGREWLEADGLGGFASGTVGGERTRRYHALLLTAATPPTGRMVLVNGFEAWVTTPAGRFAITSHRYAGDVIHPDGATRVTRFSSEPWPTWEYALEDGTRVEQEILALHDSPAVLVSWRLVDHAEGITLEVRPLLSGRDYHATHHENGAAHLEPDHGDDGALVWRVYEGVPAIASSSRATYAHEPCWYRRFLYTAERERGLDCLEDLASPGSLRWDLSDAPAHWILSTGSVPPAADADRQADLLRERERARRARFASPLERAGDAYIVRRGAGLTVIAGYPWFTDWGRDTFISLPGLCLATGRLEDAVRILVAWAGTVSDGMLPNRFADAGQMPEFNAADASLWFVVAVEELREAARARQFAVGGPERRALEAAVLAIVSGYAAGTRHGIRVAEDGLLAAGAPGVQLTWMDARVDGREVTPRIGKPVELQALWVNALASAARHDPRWTALRARAAASFAARFWNESAHCLYDVVDVDHEPAVVDASIRPNQLLAVGGLPVALLAGDRARRVLEVVARTLLVPTGMRTLAPTDPRYRGTYGGGVAERDGAYHQGTAWSWLLYAYVDAVRRHAPAGEFASRASGVLTGLERQLDVAGLGHVAEVTSGDPPHAAGGCPFQAWSLAALLRVRALVASRAGAAVVEV